MTNIELLNKVITAIENSKEEICVCIPDTDYYAKSGAITETTLSIISPYTLCQEIEQIISDLNKDVAND